MSPTSNTQRPVGRLKVVAASNATEIRVVDGRFTKVELPRGNTGTIDIEVPFGLYEVSFRNGAVWSAGTAVVVFSSDPDPVLESSSADPEMLSDSPVPGVASVIVGVGDLPWMQGDAAGSMAELVLADLSSRLTLVKADGSPGPTPVRVNDNGWLGVEFPAGAGYWRLCLTVGSEDPPLEMAVVVCPGWRTEIRLSTRAEWERTQWAKRADLATVTVRMRPLVGMPWREEPGDRRLEKNALASLAEGRVLHGTKFNETIRRLADGKFCNPMFGLYAGYMIPGNTPEELELLDLLATRLESILTRGPMEDLVPPPHFYHPDLRALRLRHSRLTKANPIPTPIDLPPVLAAGWKEILFASQSSPSIVGENTLCERIAGKIWGPSVWLIWTRPPVDMQWKPSIPDELGTGSAVIPGLQVDWTAEAISNRLEGFPRSVPSGNESNGRSSIEDDLRVIDTGLCHEEVRQWIRAAELSANEKAVAFAIRQIADTEERQATAEALRLRLGRRPPPADGEQLAAAVQLPYRAAVRAARSLAAKIRLQGTANNLQLQARAETMSRPQLIIPYDPGFLGDGFEVPLPGLSPALRAASVGDGTVFDYTHYSVVMHRDRRVAAVTANNIDASRTVRGISGGLTWKMDERVGEYQLGPETYDHNKLDKGHLVRREDVLWGTVPEARAANAATYFYSNAAPQHENFNQDEWKSLEDWVLKEATDFSFRLCVLTGPVLRQDDPVLSDLPPALRVAFNTRQAQIPAAFWKVIVLRDARNGGDDLSAVAFAMKQTEMWNDRDGQRLLNLKVHQVTMSAIERWTGLDFGALRDVDELEWSQSHDRSRELARDPEWPKVHSAEDIVYSGTIRRARGLRAVRKSETMRFIDSRSLPGDRAVPAGTSPGGCGCGPAEFDAREAVASLGRDIARLSESLARSGSPPVAQPEGPGTRSIVTDARVEEMTSATPVALQNTVAAFAQRLFSFADVTAGRIASPPELATRIVGGDEVAPGDFLSCCCIGGPGQWFCTGVVVAPRVVLTAAHCGNTITRVMVGASRFDSPSARIIDVRRVVIHPLYRPHPLNQNDINVLILAADAIVQVAPLATDAGLAAAENVALVGFGYNDPMRPLGFGIKRRVTAPLLKLPEGTDLGSLPSTLGFHPEYELVAGRKGLGRDSCNGDSGGPAYIEAGGAKLLVGLTSRATRTALVNCGDGGIYVRPQKFRDWINGILVANGLSKLPD